MAFKRVAIYFSLISALLLSGSFFTFADFSFLAQAAEPQAGEQTTSTAKNLESLDLEARKKVLENVFNISQTELKTIKEKLEKLELGDDWKEPRENLLKRIPEFEAFYKTQAEKLAAENLTLDDIKNQAKEIKTWRQETFSPFLKESSSMLLIFEEEALLKIAHSRLDKISEDISKLEKQSFPKIESLKTMFSQAKDALSISEELHSNAKNLLYKALTISKSENETATTTEEELSPALEAPALQEGAEKPGEKKIEIQDLIQDLIKKSFEELKSTYETFIKMSKII